MIKKKRRIGVIVGLTSAILILALVGTVLTAQWFKRMKQLDTEIILDLTWKNIEEMFTASQNEAVFLATHMKGELDNIEGFHEIARQSMTKEGISEIYLIKGTTVVAAVSESSGEDNIGKELNQLPYVFSMAKLIKETVIEGPIQLDDGREIFLFIEPILLEDEYWGQVVVVEDAQHVVTQLGLSYLDEKGYDYQLWQIDSQNGEKRVVTSSDPQKDMSSAIRKVDYLPTEWTLAIEPSEGWISFKIQVVSSLLVLLALFAILACGYFMVEKQKQRLKEVVIRNSDTETGILNRSGFVKELNGYVKKGLTAYTLIIFVMDEYIPLARVMDERQRKDYLEYVIAHLNDRVNRPHIYCRIGEACYALAVLDTLTDNEGRNLAKELALDLLWKIEIYGRKEFIHAKWRMLRYPEDGAEISQLIAEGMKLFDEQHK